MAFPSKFKGGGKKGMKQNNGAKRSTVKLRPAPAPEPLDAPSSTKSRKGKGKAVVPQEREREDEEDDDEEEEEEEFGYKEGLKTETKPLEGLTVTISGCGKDKAGLCDLAAELGGTLQPALTSDTTHLVADAAGSPKFDVSRARLLL
jgi:hypothetical protein